MVISFCEELLKRVRERRAVYVDRLSSGTFQTLEDYKFIVGKLKGVEEMESEVKKLYSDMFEPRNGRTEEGINE